MWSFFNKHGKTIAMIIAVFGGLMLLITAVFLTNDYKTEITKSAAVQANYNTFETRQAVENSLGKYVTKAIANAEVITESVSSETDLKTYLMAIEDHTTEQDENFYVKFVRCIKDGVLLDSSLDPSERTMPNYCTAHPDTAGYAGKMTDSFINQQLVCFYAPVRNSDYADGILLYYTYETLNKLYVNDILSRPQDGSVFRVFCTSDGNVIGGDMTDPDLFNGDTVEVGSLLATLKGVIGDGPKVREVTEALTGGKDTFVSMNIGSTEYVMAFSTSADTMSGLVVVELFPVNELYVNGLQTVYTIVAIIILFGLIALGVSIFLVIHNISIRRRLFNTETKDAVLDCFNRYGFEREVEKIIARNNLNYSSIVELHISHYPYLLEKFGKEEVSSLIRYIRGILPRFLRIEETFGYADEGNFFLLIHATDKDDLIGRLKLIAYAIGRFRNAKVWNLQPKYGVFEIEKQDSVAVPQMIDYAIEANKTVTTLSAEAGSLPIHFYDNELRRVRMLNENMEIRMEYALQSGEFQVFYQPKYNLNTKTIEGAEALVRWYNVDTKVYERPNLFMALFESNGFIIKLDKYVFTKVCEFISYCTAHGKPVYPVSVNISRVTAVQPDFLEFYTREKKKFGIADGMIMIEFTESFAYENYENLEKIVTTLHMSGFKCSIDDFGCGYSSYQILKMLPMDEIKLDRMFMLPGLSYDRDQDIFQSIIELSKKLNMMVTQEGVEEPADVERMRALGCDVIQGYVYARPMPLSDYLTFLTNARDKVL